MSISSLITTASSGLLTAQAKIGLSYANLANADDPTASRKSLDATIVTTSEVLTQGTVSRVTDAYLSKTAITSAAAAAHDSTLDDYMQSYDAALGTTDGGTNVSSLLDKFQSALTALAAAPSSGSAKGQVVTSAADLANSLNGLSSQVQSLRTQANAEVGTTVDAINGDLTTLASLNDQIAVTKAQQQDTTGLEDQRDAALSDLSQMVGISYYTTSDNRVQVYATGGAQLLGAHASQLSYTPSSSLSAQATYPGAISGVTLNGKDITASLTDGKLGALLDLRDHSLVDEQSKLDTLSAGLIGQVNAVANAGTASPPPNSVTSRPGTVVSGTDAFSATGTLRVAVVSSSGALVGSQDLDLSTFATVDDLVTALNGISGVTASVSSSGQLTIGSPDSANGVALADIGAAVSPSGSGVSAYFGFNDVLQGTGSGNIAVSASLAADPTRLPTTSLGTGTVNPGDIAIASGDTTTVGKLSAILGANLVFPASGGQAAGIASLQGYAASFVAGAAAKIADASTQSDTTTAIHDAATTRLQNMSAVNLDEELGKIQDYQQQYQANAQMIALEKTLFDTLVTMMN
jgi:flagellar hook-associated protein 1 FlgK